MAALASTSSSVDRLTVPGELISSNGSTSTDKEAELASPSPRQLIEKAVAPTAFRVIFSVPDASFVPDQPPEAEQEVALVLDQVRARLSPRTAWLALLVNVNVTLGNPSLLPQADKIAAEAKHISRENERLINPRPHITLYLGNARALGAFYDRIPAVKPHWLLHHSLRPRVPH